MTIEDAGLRVTVRRTPEAGEGVVAAPVPPSPAPEEETTAAAPPAPPFDPGMIRVEAPMVGTFYRASSPGAPPFVEEGDAVGQGQTLCILEAMKLMNEVKAEQEGVVTRIHPENGQAVEYGQLLFELEPVNGRPSACSAVAVFTRVLVANRGEIAVRVIRALHELGIEAVAIYSTADADALHVRLADRAVCIGPPPPADSYLNIPSVVAAAETTGCQAVHPGYGFLAERPDFVRACTDNDLVFVGPDAEVMARMGDKVQAKIAMREAGVPLVPGTEGATTLAQARELAPEIGFPLLLKAAAGGGGRGMRLVASADELDDAFATASAEADAAFGDGSLYVEKALVPAGTWRSRCSRTPTAASSPSASASARSSAATRS